MDIDAEISTAYVEGESAYKIAARLGLKPNDVYYRLKKAGVKCRSNKMNSRKWMVNHDYFSNIDTEHRAYWFGFLSADGSLTSGNGQKVIRLRLSFIDRGHIVALLTDLESDYPISDYTTITSFGECRVSDVAMTSEKMYADLSSHGCVQNKAKTLGPPTLTGDLARHYIRGFVDGDGCLARGSTHKCGLRLKISGREEVLRWINSQLIRNGSLYPYKDRDSWSLEAHPDNIKWLYENSTVSLGRKRAMAEQVGLIPPGPAYIPERRQKKGHP